MVINSRGYLCWLGMNDDWLDMLWDDDRVNNDRSGVGNDDWKF
jgi:hypothetical protein